MSMDADGFAQSELELDLIITVATFEHGPIMPCQVASRGLP